MNSNKLKSAMEKLIAREARHVEFKRQLSIELRYSEDMPEFHWHTAGIAYGGDLIILNRDFIELNWDDIKAIGDLVGHEIIHRKMPSSEGHGKLFREECVKYGIHPGILGGKVHQYWRKEVHGRTPKKKPPRITFEVTRQ